MLETEGASDCIRADAVILALPPRVVAQNFSFCPQLPPDFMAGMVDKPTWMASQAKVIAVYERLFWREHGLSGLASSWEGPLQEIHDASPDTGAGAFFLVSLDSRRKRAKNWVRKTCSASLWINWPDFSDRLQKM